MRRGGEEILLRSRLARRQVSSSSEDTDEQRYLCSEEPKALTEDFENFLGAKKPDRAQAAANQPLNQINLAGKRKPLIFVSQGFSHPLLPTQRRAFKVDSNNNNSLRHPCNPQPQPHTTSPTSPYQKPKQPQRSSIPPPSQTPINTYLTTNQPPHPPTHPSPPLQPRRAHQALIDPTIHFHKNFRTPQLGVTVVIFYAQSLDICSFIEVSVFLFFFGGPAAGGGVFGLGDSWGWL